MDQERFDRIVRLFGRATTRRAGIGALAALAASVLVRGDAEQADAKAGRKHPKPEGPCGDGKRKDNICTKDKNCCTGICDTDAGKKNKDGKGRCRCVTKGNLCFEDKNCCNGRACTKGVCGGTPTPPTCDATSCAGGCCNGTTCVAYASQSTSQCGTGGVACAACTGSDTCNGSGVCTPPTPSCDATSCSGGCCDGTTCLPYASQTDGQCGTSGAACAACASGKDCVSGSCLLPTCDVTTCATGCCDSNNTCVAYGSQSDGQCGTNGETCAPCDGGFTCGGGYCSGGSIG
jgi:hypothetical protein